MRRPLSTRRSVRRINLTDLCLLSDDPDRRPKIVSTFRDRLAARHSCSGQAMASLGGLHRLPSREVLGVVSADEAAQMFRQRRGDKQQPRPFTSSLLGWERARPLP
jgi:hypothetical protein